MNKDLAALIGAFSTIAACIFILLHLWVLVLMMGGIGMFSVGYLMVVGSQSTEPAAQLTDGKTQSEWYDTIRDIGPEVTEELMLGPLDGLERDKEFAWNPEKLMGAELWKHLRKEWYPDKFCIHCDKEGCVHCNESNCPWCIEDRISTAVFRKALPPAVKISDPGHAHNELESVDNLLRHLENLDDLWTKQYRKTS